jgi:murein DD-endopeptidase MepM/ murein hydrolase activator NlpD
MWWLFIFFLAGCLPASLRMVEPEGSFDASVLKLKTVSGELSQPTLVWPLDEVVVTSDYGHRGQRFHKGIDLRAAVGTRVYSCLKGRVVESSYQGDGYGRMVVIDHGNGLRSLYAHHSKVFVRRGQEVQTGQLIGLSGQTGRCTGPHLHFELLKNDEVVNPWEWIEGFRAKLF